MHWQDFVFIARAHEDGLIGASFLDSLATFGLLLFISLIMALIIIWFYQHNRHTKKRGFIKKAFFISLLVGCALIPGLLHVHLLYHIRNVETFIVLLITPQHY